MISNNEFKAIAELDLDPIKVKLMHEESGEGWSLEQANMVEFEYRRFLYLMKMFPTEQTAPLFDVDIFWHYHILDTMKYAVDCENVFGYFLHHFPYIGLRGEDDEAAHQRIGARMQQLYEDTFDEPYVKAAQRSSGSAWSAAVAQSADRAAEVKPAWSASVARTAWSAAVGQTAWSAAVSTTGAPALADGRTAWSAAVSKVGAPSGAQTAWSAAVGKTAWSAAVGKTAWSAAAGNMAWSAAASQDRGAAHSIGDETQAASIRRFYSERPTLAAA